MRGNMTEERYAEVKAMEDALKPKLNETIKRMREEQQAGFDDRVCVRAWIDYTPGGRAIIRRCSSTYLCGPCDESAVRRYPQGYRYYPGDVCKHGVYIGGSGIDWLCGACESGE